MVSASGSLEPVESYSPRGLATYRRNSPACRNRKSYGLEPPLLSQLGRYRDKWITFVHSVELVINGTPDEDGLTEAPRIHVDAAILQTTPEVLEPP